MAFSEYWRSTSFFPSLTASNSSSSPSSSSSLMDPSTSASATQEWGLEETSDFIRILGMTQYHHHHHHHHDSDVNWYGDGDGDSYWLMVASKMGALGKGYPARTPLNLKSKCQHLLSIYIKAKEQQELKGGCPFYDELQAIFTHDNRSMPRVYAVSGQQEQKSQEIYEEPVKNVESGREQHTGQPIEARDKKRMKVDDKKGTPENQEKAGGGWEARPEKGKGSKLFRMQEVLEEFLQHQHRLEMIWKGEMERREEERRLRAQESRTLIETLERERMMKEQQWREREEQRMLREEARAERRDALFNAIFNMLMREDQKSFTQQP